MPALVTQAKSIPKRNICLVEPKLFGETAFIAGIVVPAAANDDFSPSRLGNKRRRACISKDRRILRKLGFRAASARLVGGPPLVTKGLTPIRHKEHVKRTEADEIPAALRPDELMSSWHLIKEGLRVWACNAAVAQMGEPIAFSLNVAPDRVAKALASPEGFTNHLLRRIKRELRNELKRPIAGVWLAADITSAGRLHIHGGLTAAGNELSQLPAIEAALRCAAPAGFGRAQPAQNIRRTRASNSTLTDGRGILCGV